MRISDWSSDVCSSDLDLLIEGMTRSLARQDAAPIGGAIIGMHQAASAFGEPRRPGADRHHLQPAVVPEALDHGAQRVEMGDDGAIGRRPAALEVRADRTAARSEEHTSELQSLMRIS